jgi:hypothetical protein
LQYHALHFGFNIFEEVATARSKKQEARSKKQEARSKKQEARKVPKLTHPTFTSYSPIPHIMRNNCGIVRNLLVVYNP